MQPQPAPTSPPPVSAFPAWAAGEISAAEARRLIMLLPPRPADLVTDYAIVQQLY